jgi:hypothetical protein
MLGCWWTGRERDVGLLPVAFTLAFVVHRLKWVRATVSDVRRVLRGKEISGWGWRGGLGQRQVNLRDVGRKHRLKIGRKNQDQGCKKGVLKIGYLFRRLKFD